MAGKVIFWGLCVLVLGWFISAANAPRHYDPASNPCLGDQNNMVPLWCVR